MKILILTVSAGEGHNAMSRALELYINSLEDKNIEVRTFDLFKNKSKFKSWVVNDLYFNFSKFSIGLSNWFYNKQKNNKKTKNTIVHKLTRGAKKPLIDELNSFKPDAIFAAHTYAAALMSDFKKDGIYDMPVVFLASDYDITAYLQTATNVDHMIIPHHSFEKGMIKIGFKKEQIKNLGIPVQTKFSKQIDKIEARKALNVDENLFTIMIMNGGMGFGNNELLVRNISKVERDFQIIVVNGRNEAMYNKINSFIEKNNLKNIHNLGFANNVDIIMSASDILVGKIGGVAISEAFNKNLPIIASKKLPWQEYDNMLFLKSRNACEYLTHDEHIITLITDFIDNPEKLAAMKKEIGKIAKPNATVEIATLLMEEAKKYKTKNSK